MTILLTILHILVCVFLILVVLTQQGKGQDLASAFGGAGTQAAFGARGTATLLTRVTAGAAATFMVTSLALGYVASDASEQTVVDDIGVAPTAAPAEEPAPEPGGVQDTDPGLEPAPEGESAGEEPPAEEPERQEG